MDYENMQVADLKGLAKGSGLRGYSGLKKAELIAFLRDNVQPHTRPPPIPAPYLLRDLLLQDQYPLWDLLLKDQYLLQDLLLQDQYPLWDLFQLHTPGHQDLLASSPTSG